MHYLDANGPVPPRYARVVLYRPVRRLFFNVCRIFTLSSWNLEGVDPLFENGEVK